MGFPKHYVGSDFEIFDNFCHHHFTNKEDAFSSKLTYIMAFDERGIDVESYIRKDKEYVPYQPYSIFRYRIK